MTSARPGCPVHRGEQKTSFEAAHPGPAVTRDEAGRFHVHGFEAAREVLRGELVKQAGFGAELTEGLTVLRNAPVLFAEGEHHHEMRRATARYFTPAAVSTYRRMMERFADDLIWELVRKGSADLDDLSLKMAVQVAARVVGLTDSALPGMGKRIASFVENGDTTNAQGRNKLQIRLSDLSNQARLLSFFALDVKPAIRQRRRKPQEDVISHVLAQGYNDFEILTECLTYGTAGMVTTREFISVAAWHLIERPELRERYLHGTERERHALLHEILRLEPVVAELYRRATADLTLDGTFIPAGSLIVLHLHAANTDEEIVGEKPLALCPGRPLPRGVPAQVMSFGDGHHRCPGAFVAIQESDIFLRRLLALRDVRIVNPPRVKFNETVKGYELRGFKLAVGG